ncbi:hypothetical protein [Acinetobacter dispersus]|uniref:hypothetical protein n=1 Tax=Acinetobacter dispersus TaxID=70348 RepID=UPI00132EF219|nr:hypothetical protein [Acinetobacter dispersus]QHH99210.1 hypothetical protein FPL17_17345 [Acinetobacter dispersus]
MTPQEKEKFIGYCTQNLGMSKTDKAFEVTDGNHFFKSEDTRRLFVTWWQMDHAEKSKCSCFESQGGQSK